MELMFWWLLPVAAAAAGAAVWAALRSNRLSNGRRRPVAHADRLTALPEYQAALRRHRRWLVLAGAACAVLLVSTAVAAARPLTCPPSVRSSTTATSCSAWTPPDR
ncbi:hypothetical protein [Arthrobacter sp. FX8]|uniref:hypothetical protein n=1 Tax=Arthrobacter sp. FX8 TaxID=2997335 RepID=UPI002DD6974D|nr:hypothetical protein [Arthrobacter sp. FX8]